MTSRITTVVFDARDGEKLAAFWAAVLDGTVRRLDEPEAADDEWLVTPKDGSGSVVLLFQKVAEPKTVKNRVHLDVNPVGVDQAKELERLLALGAQPVDVGQGEPTWVVLADPEGNEFCLLRRTVD